jgi:Zn-dependent protease
MRGNIYLGRLIGIPFYLHWSWFLALFLIAWTLGGQFFPDLIPDLRGEPGWSWGLGLVAALGLFLSILLHELGHAVVARRLDIPVRSIRLFIFGGVAELGGEPRKPSHEIGMALGGPAVTVILILLYAIGWNLLIAVGGVGMDLERMEFTGGSWWAVTSAAVLLCLTAINIAVLVFNLIPAFPLDGGRVFRGILWSATGSYLRGTQIAGAFGVGFGWLLFLWGFYNAFYGDLIGAVWMFFLGMFLQNAAQSSVTYAQMQELLAGVRVREMMRTQPVALDADLTLNEVLDHYFLRYPYKAYPVVENGRPVGVLTLRMLQEVDRQEWPVLRARDLVERREPTPILHPDEPVLNALRKMSESEQSRLPVVDNGQLVGLLCRRDIMAFLEVRAGLAETRGRLTPARPEDVVEEVRSSA